MLYIRSAFVQLPPVLYANWLLFKQLSTPSVPKVLYITRSKVLAITGVTQIPLKS